MEIKSTLRGAMLLPVAFLQSHSHDGIMQCTEIAYPVKRT